MPIITGDRDVVHRRLRPRRRVVAVLIGVVLTCSATGCSSSSADDMRTTAPSSRAASRTPPGTGAPSSSSPASATTSATLPVNRAVPARAGVTFGSSLYALNRRELARALDDVVSLHATWIRIDLSWAGIQPVSASQHDWTDVDAVVAAARARRLDVLGLITYTPPWARSAGCTRFSCPPRSNAEFATFAADAVRRYAPRGVRTYQIWNEPNITAFWRSPDPAAYGALLRSTTTAMRRAAAGLRILFGSLAFTGDDPATRAAGTIDAAPFLRRACVRRTCDVDAIGYDPFTYPRLPSDTGAPLNAWQRIANPAAGATTLRSAMATVGLGRATVWVTAFGAPTTTTTSLGATDRRMVSEARQAAILRDGARLAGESPQVVGAFFVNTLRDDATAGPLGGHFGLIRADGTRKPAFAALAAVLRP